MQKNRKLIIALALVAIIVSQIACETGPSWGGISSLVGVVSVAQ